MESMDVDSGDFTTSSFVKEFRKGDKIYGLAGDGIGRNRYICTPEFYNTFGHLDYTTDQLNNRFLGTGALDGPSIYFSNLMWGIEPTAFSITPSQSDEVDAFRMFLENHEKSKYRPHKFSGSEHRNIRIARACKAALEFTTIQMNRRIHFILDDIDLCQVAMKRPTPNGFKSITGQELRFIYRNEIRRDFESGQFSKHQKNPKPLTLSVYGRKRREEVESREGIAAETFSIASAETTATVSMDTSATVSAETSAINSTIVRLVKAIGAQGTFDTIQKDKKIVDNIVFWSGGQPTVTPWDSGIAKDIWYGMYGSKYDKKISATKAGMKKSINTLSSFIKETPRPRSRRGNNANVFTAP